ncbi:MAG TPA: hypothetical protein VEL74_13535, partial [Thermoanaerobaculia bacterium]|nr:hypothetical protein [Thermoanaerobaculia bacterium]
MHRQDEKVVVAGREGVRSDPARLLRVRPPSPSPSASSRLRRADRTPSLRGPEEQTPEERPPGEIERTG